MTEEKTEKISISLDRSLLMAIDANATNRSAYFSSLARRDLEAAGKLPGTPEAEVSAMVAQLMKSQGAASVRAAIAPLFDAAVASEA